VHLREDAAATALGSGSVLLPGDPPAAWAPVLGHLGPADLQTLRRERVCLRRCPDIGRGVFPTRIVGGSRWRCAAEKSEELSPAWVLSELKEAGCACPGPRGARPCPRRATTPGDCAAVVLGTSAGDLIATSADPPRRAPGQAALWHWKGIGKRHGGSGSLNMDYLVYLSWA
jgi:hypothetical protein